MSITKIVSNILNQSIGIAGCGEMGYPMLKMLLQNDINATGHDIKASKNFKDFGERYISSKSHFFEKNDVSINGIYNVGTGKARTFNDVADSIIEWVKKNSEQKPVKRFIAFPDHLKKSYQNFTQANIDKLRLAGYDGKFTSLEDGISQYMKWFNDSDTNS